MTSPLRVLIADDEPLGRRRMALALERAEGVALIGEACDGTEALALIDALAPDIALLDILMPGLSGMEVCAAAATHSACAFIFITAHDHFAREAFDVAAVDYILKPFSLERFNQALARAARFCEQRRIEAAADGEGFIKEVWVADGLGRRRVAVETIDWISAERDYSRIHIGSESLLCTQPLGRLEAQLDPARFLRVHRSALVRMAAVQKVVRAENGRIQLQTAAASPTPVGRRCRSSLGRLFQGADREC